MRYYIADSHFFSEKLNHSLDHRGFQNAESMNRYMISQWNKKVHPNDEVVILGDLSNGTAEETNQLLEKLHGRLYLILGNHDRFLSNSQYNCSRFVWIRPYAELKDNHRKVILCHYPIPCYNGQYLVDKDNQPKTYMLHGHIHNSHDQVLMDQLQKMTRETTIHVPDGIPKHIPSQMINCFCQFSDYLPLTLDEWILCDQQRKVNFPKPRF